MPLSTAHGIAIAFGRGSHMPKSRDVKSVSAVIAIVNTNDDLVNAVRDALTAEGYGVVSAHIRDMKAGKVDFDAFLRSHAPAVVIYDIAVPYEDNWTFFQTLRKLPEAQKVAFVITTVNTRALEARVRGTGAIEIVGGRGDDLEPVVEAVREQLKHRRKE